MKEVFEATLGVFLFAVMMIVCTSTTNAFIDGRNLDATMHAYTIEIEHSDFAPDVVRGVLTDMKELSPEDNTHGTITLYFADQSDPITFKSVSDVDKYESDMLEKDIDLAKIELTYNYGLSFLKNKQTHIATAYATARGVVA